MTSIFFFVLAFHFVGGKDEVHVEDVCTHVLTAGYAFTPIHRSQTVRTEGEYYELTTETMHGRSGECCCASSLRADSGGRSYGVHHVLSKAGSSQNLQKGSKSSHRKKKADTRLGLAHLNPKRRKGRKR